jgi:hypothetical protein
MAEARVKVRLDTKQASGDLRQLTREAAKTAGRVGGGLKRAVTRGLGAIGLGGGIAAGLAAVRGATQAGLGDVMGEAFGPLGAQIAGQFYGQDLLTDARAAKSARDQLSQNFAYLIGKRGEAPPAAVNWFNQVKTHQEVIERGRQIIREDTQFYGPQYDEIIGKIMDNIGGMLADAADKLGDRLTGAVGSSK